MFDEDDRRLVQVASIANAIGVAENAAPWRALIWLAGEAEAGTLAASLYIPVRMRTVDTTRASPKESIEVWRSMARRVQAARKRDKLNCSLPSAASTWHVHVNDLLRFAETATMTGPVRTELLDLARRHCASSDPKPAQAGPAPAPMPRSRAQEAAILAKLAELGFNAQALPVAPAGKASPAKSAVRAALKYTADVMNKAWQRLRSEGLIREA